MISLDKARELKEAGLEWQPQFGDAVIDSGKPLLVIYGDVNELGMIEFQSNSGWHEGNFYIWLPSLSQLLAEIEARGFTWDMGNLVTGGYKFILYTDSTPNGNLYCESTPEDVAADALIWVLKEGQ